VLLRDALPRRTRAAAAVAPLVAALAVAALCASVLVRPFASPLLLLGCHEQSGEREISITHTGAARESAATLTAPTAYLRNT
jgi:hypothetical protein